MIGTPAHHPRSIELADGVVTAPTSTSDGVHVIDATGLWVAPGFVDLQINGGFGIDLAADPEAMWELGRQLPATGVTAFLPTIVSGPETIRRRALSAALDRPPDHLGADPVGVHLEGPMLAPSRPGAHPPDRLRQVDPEVVAGWSRDAGLIMTTIAPELDGACEVIEALCDQGVVVALGHSAATAEEAERGIDSGASMVTHLFNAMSPLHHREPGLAGVALIDERVTAGLIADGVHLDPRAVTLVLAAVGPDRLALVTDAIAAMGAPDGEHRLGDTSVITDDGAPRNADGTLAGSTLTMDRAVRNLVAFTGCHVDTAVRCAATTPARVARLAGRGTLTEGSVADVVMLDPDLHVAMTICRGRLAHVAEGLSDRLPAQLAVDAV